MSRHPGSRLFGKEETASTDWDGVHTKRSDDPCQHPYTRTSRLVSQTGLPDTQDLEQMIYEELTYSQFRPDVNTTKIRRGQSSGGRVEVTDSYESSFRPGIATDLLEVTFHGVRKE